MRIFDCWQSFLALITTETLAAPGFFFFSAQTTNIGWLSLRWPKNASGEIVASHGCTSPTPYSCSGSTCLCRERALPCLPSTLSAPARNPEGSGTETNKRPCPTKSPSPLVLLLVQRRPTATDAQSHANFQAKGNSKTFQAASVTVSAEQKWWCEGVNWAREIRLSLPCSIHLRVCFAHKLPMEFSSYFPSGIPASGQLHFSQACSQLANSLKCVALITYPAFVQEGCCVVVCCFFFSWSSAYFVFCP